MTKKKISRADLMHAASMKARERLAADRRKRPHLYATPNDDILYVENVAELLGCSTDYVRRIPRRELPAARCGPRLQYLREDVVTLLRRRRDLGQGKKVDLQPQRTPPASMQVTLGTDDIVAKTVAKLSKLKT